MEADQNFLQWELDSRLDTEKPKKNSNHFLEKFHQKEKSRPMVGIFFIWRGTNFARNKSDGNKDLLSRR